MTDGENTIYPVVLNEKENEVLEDLCSKKDLSPSKIFKMGLALFQLYDLGIVKLTRNMKKRGFKMDAEYDIGNISS